MALSPRTVWSHRVRNWLHSGLLLLAMAAWAAALGWLLLGPWGLAAGLAGAAIAVAMAGRVTPRMVLRMYGAQKLAFRQAPGLHRIMDALADRAQLDETPELYWIRSPIPNAISVGSRTHPGIAVTDGLIRRLPEREVIAVLAHETSHITNGDLLVMALADSISRFTGFLGQMGMVLLILGLCMGTPQFLAVALVLAIGPSLSTLLMLGLSRSREYAADLEAVQLTGDPRGLASALQRIEQPRNVLEQLVGLPGRDMNPSVLRTHPATEDRIERLLELEAEAPRVETPDGPFVRMPPVDRSARRTWWGAWH